MGRIPEDYRTMQLLNSGYDEPAVAICPVCGEEAEYIYKDSLGYIIGCDCCIRRIDANDVSECFAQEEL